jgi:hypothetical protein
MKSSIQSKRLQLPNDIEDLVSVLAVGGSGAGGGSGGGGIGGGGGSPGGGTPGGGGSGGKPGGESVGNNLSFPAIFFDPMTQEALRGDPGAFLFTTPTDLGDEYRYFAQGVEGNVWQADSSVAATPVTIDYVDIGDALESAPIKAGTNVRLELTLYQDLINLDSGEPGDGLSQTAYAMTLLGGAKGSGKPSIVGPTESQGARLPESAWDGSPYAGDIATAPAGTTFESNVASVCAAEGAGEGAVNSYMSMSIQKVEGLAQGDLVTGLAWDGTKWVDADPTDSISVGGNLVTTAFGPELNIAGKYIMGASGKPYKFTADGNYLVTFALEDGTRVRLDESTLVQNDADPATLGYQPGDAAGRITQVIADGVMSYSGSDGDTHNGLLAMIVGVPSNPTEELM